VLQHTHRQRTLSGNFLDISLVRLLTPLYIFQQHVAGKSLNAPRKSPRLGNGESMANDIFMSLFRGNLLYVWPEGIIDSAGPFLSDKNSSALCEWPIPFN